MSLWLKAKTSAELNKNFYSSWASFGRVRSYSLERFTSTDGYPRQNANVNLYHVTKFSLLLSFTVHYIYLKLVVSGHFHPKNYFAQFLFVHFLI